MPTSTSSVPAQRTAIRGRGPHQHALPADGGEQADLRRADRRPDLDGGVAGRDVVPGAADVAAGRRPGVDGDPHGALVGPDRGDDDVGAGRQHRAGGHLEGEARADGGRRAGPGDALPHDRQLDRAPRGVAPRDVLGAGGVAVERGLVEGGQRPLADDLLGAEQALRVEDGELDRVRLGHRGEDLVEVPLHGADLCQRHRLGGRQRDRALDHGRGPGTGRSAAAACAREPAATRRRPAPTGPVARGGAIGMSTCAVSRYPRYAPPVLSSL